MRSPPTNLLIGLACLVPLLLLALAGAFYTPHDPLSGDLLARLAPPSARHWLGTDELGRDVLSRLMAGAGASVAVCAGTVLFAVGAGTLIGVCGGYLGGWADRLLGVLLDALMAFPSLLLALGVIAVLGPSALSVVLALGLAYTPSAARLARASAIALRRRDFVLASRAMGNSGLWTLWRHILPNVAPPMLVFATTLLGSALLAESALSFLGLGVAPPAPSWGGMLADARGAMERAIWLSVVPGAMIAIALVGINLLGDALRDVLDPRMRGGA